MRRAILTGLFIIGLLTARKMLAQNAAVANYCQQGAIQSKTSGLPSTNFLQGIIPQCTVTVYNTGTTNKASIYSDGTGTPLSNPFTANTDGSWIFFAAANQGYDVVMSGGVPPNQYAAPRTLTGLFPSQQVLSANISNQVSGTIPLASGPSSLNQPSHLDDGVMQPGVISSSEPFNSGAINGLLSVAIVARPDRDPFTNVQITAGSNTLVSTDAGFTTANTGAGKLITVPIGPQGIKASTYVSGATVSGLSGQTCVVSGFDGGGTGADAYVTLNSTSTIGSTLIFTQYGTGYTSLATTATLSNGSATCSGTITLSGGSFYVWPVTTTITYVNATTVTLGTTATTTVNGNVGGSLGTDNTPLIQSQITASRTSDNCVVIPPGNYMLGSPIIVTGGECIEGYNGFLSAANSTVLYAAAGSAAIATPDPSTNNYAQLSNFTIKDLYIVGGQDGIDLGLSHFVTLDRVTFQDQTGYGFAHVRGERHSVTNIQCFHNSVAAVGCISVAEWRNSIYSSRYANHFSNAITNVSANGTTATITITAGTNYPRTGQTVTITGLTNSGLNGTWTVLSGLPTSFTFSTSQVISSTPDSGNAAFNWNDEWWDKAVMYRFSDQGPDEYSLWAGGTNEAPTSFSNVWLNYFHATVGQTGTASKSLMRFFGVAASTISDLSMDNIKSSGTAAIDVEQQFYYSTIEKFVAVGIGNAYRNAIYFVNGDFQESAVQNCYLGGDNSTFYGVHFGTSTSANGTVRDIRGSFYSDSTTTAVVNHINMIGGLINPIGSAGGIFTPGAVNFSDQTNNGMDILLAADQLGNTASTSAFKVWHVTGVQTYKNTFQVTSHGPAAPGTGIMNLPPITTDASPQNGDIYTKTAGVFAWINGAEVGPFSTSLPCTSNCSFAGTTSFAGINLTGPFTMVNTTVLSWNSDTGISRVAAGTIAIGNGTASDASGQIRASQFRISNSGFLNSLASNTLTASRSIIAPDGNSATVIPVSVTTTAATSDNVAVQGMTGSGHCGIGATNVSAATNVAATYVSAKTTNQITLTHTATSGMTYDLLCTPN